MAGWSTAWSALAGQLSLCMQVTGQLEDCLTSLLGYVALFQITS